MPLGQKPATIPELSLICAVIVLPRFHPLSRLRSGSLADGNQHTPRSRFLQASPRESFDFTIINAWRTWKDGHGVQARPITERVSNSGRDRIQSSQWPAPPYFDRDLSGRPDRLG